MEASITSGGVDSTYVGPVIQTAQMCDQSAAFVVNDIFVDLEWLKTYRTWVVCVFGFCLEQKHKDRVSRILP